MPYDEMLSWLLFYTGILDLQRLPQMEIADPVGLVQSQALINDDQGLRVILNGSSATRTLSARFINEFFGSGVQHIAFSCSDIFAAVADMRARGADFLKIPDNYYDDIEAKYDLDAATMAALRANQILYDREGEGEFFQIYTHTFDERFFFEIVQRRNYQRFRCRQCRSAPRCADAGIATVDHPSHVTWNKAAICSSLPSRNSLFLSR